MRLRLLALAALLPLATVAPAADWSRFRGPNGGAFSEEKGLPTKWSDSSEGALVWKPMLKRRSIRYRVTVEKAYLVTEMVAFWSI